MRLQHILFKYPMRATCFAHLSIYYLIFLTIPGDQYKRRLSSHFRGGSSDKNNDGVCTRAYEIRFLLSCEPHWTLFIYESVLCQVWVYVLCAPSLNKFISVCGCDVYGGDNVHQLAVLLNPRLCDLIAHVQSRENLPTPPAG
jgi:hypothetical protein